MTAEELQDEVQKLAPEGVKVIMSKNTAEITFNASDSWAGASFEPKNLDVIDPLVVAQALGFDVVPEKPKRTKQPSK